MKNTKNGRWCIMALAICSAIFVTACGKNYSNGTRVGVITKLSQKGLVFDSWEGELLMALPAEIASTTQPEKWAFNVDPQAVEKVKAAMAAGKRVELVYRQWAVGPITQDSNYTVIDVK